MSTVASYNRQGNTRLTQRLLYLFSGATHGLLSFVILFQASCEIPAGYLSSVLIKKLGYWGTLRIGFLAYSLRFGVLYFIRNPLWVLPIEALNGK